MLSQQHQQGPWHLQHFLQSLRATPTLVLPLLQPPASLLLLLHQQQAQGLHPQAPPHAQQQEHCR
jgi:hypothetical protein